jgi:hypothetical protein
MHVEAMNEGSQEFLTFAKELVNRIEKSLPPLGSVPPSNVSGLFKYPYSSYDNAFTLTHNAAIARESFEMESVATALEHFVANPEALRVGAPDVYKLISETMPKLPQKYRLGPTLGFEFRSPPTAAEAFVKMGLADELSVGDLLTGNKTHITWVYTIDDMFDAFNKLNDVTNRAVLDGQEVQERFWKFIRDQRSAKVSSKTIGKHIDNFTLGTRAKYWSAYLAEQETMVKVLQRETTDVLRARFSGGPSSIFSAASKEDRKSVV